MWDRNALHELIQARLRDQLLIVVANREPYIHRYVGDVVECIQPASGMASALDPMMLACGGTWVGHGSGDADRLTVDAHDRIRVPPDSPRYTLRRVWLSKEQEEGYYHGVANSGLWPLCHVAFTRPIFDSRHWQTYREVNELFADAVLQEAGDRPAFVFIQDYHFGLLPRILKRRNPELTVAQFWHIPWPNPETFRALPWKEELLDGLLGNDLLGFHLGYHCQNFLETVDRNLEARTDREQSEVVRGGHATRIRAFPISIDFERHSAAAAGPEVEREMARWRHRLKLDGKLLGLGIERIDYTKGIPERLRAIDHLLENHPEFRGRLVYAQCGVPSRGHIRAYQQLDDEIDDLVEGINWKWGNGSWRPICYEKRHSNPAEMTALHRLASFCVVSSLHDGMNLVAKEFVASRVDEDGVLVLSRFTGAARELTDALLINPFSVEELSGAMHEALTMPRDERGRRMRRMREVVAENNVYRWAGKIVSTLLRLDPDDVPPRAPDATAHPASRETDEPASLLASLDEVGEVVEAAPHRLILLDYDGTLAPIAERPEMALLPSTTRDILRQLARREDCTVGIVSGRSLEDVRARVGIEGLIYAGNHGLEISGVGLRFAEETAVSRRDGVESVVCTLAVLLKDIAGILVEDKGLSASVHYRLVRPEHRMQVERVVREAVPEDHPQFVVMPGKMVWEVRPRVLWNKGKAVRWLRERLGIPSAVTFYLGDDRTDEDAFAEVGRFVSARVGPPAPTRAGFRVADTAEVAEFLSWLSRSARPAVVPEPARG
ncbi:Trehalose-phosphate synthase [Aquisphaera giovannonii]|uniref:Trehalose-phosphate synthase n=1 Tax=Aquisphaera giovannonii TaxID=406548 RepID=A0A5B9VYP8_9BACT|nr:bifunctional alpha,alpha-trehalose-phosphate synthase (UDP-forming)/trehalose-phosphatase [Aquisphaera giovannonii]QEH33428.1 Trehalose-phosphate synthase [Aquisphaera giovannonii]